MADFDSLNDVVKETFSRMTEGTDPGRVAVSVRERIGFEKERNPGHTMRHRKRLTVLLAAAAALILLTTAAAAAVMAVQARMRIETKPPEPVEFRQGKEEVMVCYDVTMEEHTGSLTLSDGVMAAFESLNPRGEDSETPSQYIEEGSVIPFDSWQAAADWLDCGLLVNPDLGTLPNKNHALYAEYFCDEESHNRHVSISGTHSYPDAKEKIHVDAFIPLNDETWEIYNGGVAVVVHNNPEPGEAEAVSETLFTSLGDEAALVFTPADSGFWSITAHFTHEGIIYRVSVWTDDREGGEDVIRRVVEGMR